MLNRNNLSFAFTIFCHNGTNVCNISVNSIVQHFLYSLLSHIETLQLPELVVELDMWAAFTPGI